MELKSIAILAIAEDAELTDLQKHDAKYHQKGYKDGDTCKYRDLIKKGDLADMAIDPENVVGEQLPSSANQNPSTVSATKSDEDRMEEIFREYRHSMTRSDNWLKKNLGITGNAEKSKADGVLASFAIGKIDKREAFRKLAKLSSGLPSDAWKPGSKSGAKSKTVQQILPLLNISPSKTSFASVTSPWSKFYHAQGTKSYTNRQDAATGLYETHRPGGKALAREEDIPGKSPFHKHRPSFNETGSVPPSLSDKELATFKYTANGSTYPTVGNVNGRNYIVKHGVLPDGVRRNADLNKHLWTEVAADKFIRAAGLRAPACTLFERDVPKDKNAVQIDEDKLQELYDAALMYKLAKYQVEDLKNDKKASKQDIKDAEAAKDDLKDAYKSVKDSLGKKYDAYKKELKERVDSSMNLLPKKAAPKRENVKIAEYVDGGVGLVPAWYHASEAEKDAIRQQVVDAYPVMSFLENVDAFKNDNVLVDKDNRLWFVDNGACFDWRAQGGKKLLGKDENRMATSKDATAKPWFYERQDPTDEVTGYLGLAYAPDQKLLQDILSETTDAELVEAAKKYKFADLVKTLPSSLQKPGLVEYAKKLDDTVRNPPKGWID